MVFLNYSTMQMAAKIVYYGPGLCGKTTNLQYIYRKTSPSCRGEIVSLETESDRTLFFDLLPIDVGTIAGFKTRFQLYTVPGQVFYNSTRKLVLRSVDGIVFVADSQVPMLDANIESLNNLKENLSEYKVSIDEIPLVFQYNKRDLKNILSVEELNRILNPKNYPYYEAAAIYGKGVFETLKGISKLTLIAIRKKALQQPHKKTTITLTTPTNVQEAKAEAVHGHSEQVATESESSISRPTFISKQELDKEKVEFAEVTNEKAEKSSVSVKKISLRSMEEIEKQLQSLKEESTKANVDKDKSCNKAFAKIVDSLVQEPKEEEPIHKKLRIRLDGNDYQRIDKLSLDLSLLGDNLKKNFLNALSIALKNFSDNPKKIKLLLDIEILKKE